MSQHIVVNIQLSIELFLGTADVGVLVDRMWFPGAEVAASSLPHLLHLFHLAMSLWCSVLGNRYKLFSLQRQAPSWPILPILYEKIILRNC